MQNPKSLPWWGQEGAEAAGQWAGGTPAGRYDKPTGPASSWPWCGRRLESLSLGSRELKDRLKQVGGGAGLYKARGVLTIDPPWQSVFWESGGESKGEGPAGSIKIRNTVQGKRKVRLRSQSFRFFQEVKPRINSFLCTEAAKGCGWRS